MYVDTKGPVYLFKIKFSDEHLYQWQWARLQLDTLYLEPFI